ncbi:uncharacterized protein HD556DRAFT_1460907 [Suillus plorans]|uniref:Uncharacterized protein n=1 Tax=Suillus plorans TaxID=116603 RepID=A0A9P7A9P2_9AGAM|nr:uncharacterized protein HD556DRAFT_1460907 [Suillus plorans]KAG1785074.1 hypothetical protein HD556DRAFT_1460907 [Suillus plorans]
MYTLAVTGGTLNALGAISLLRFPKILSLKIMSPDPVRIPHVHCVSFVWEATDALVARAPIGVKIRFLITTLNVWPTAQMINFRYMGASLLQTPTISELWTRAQAAIAGNLANPPRLRASRASSLFVCFCRCMTLVSGDLETICSNTSGRVGKQLTIYTGYRMLYGDDQSGIDLDNQQSQQPPKSSQESLFLQARQRRKIAELEGKLETLESGR